MKFNNQKKGMLLAFTAIMFITPDSLLIRLANIETWGMIFYRGAIPFVVVLIGLLLFYKKTTQDSLTFKVQRLSTTNGPLNAMSEEEWVSVLRDLQDQHKKVCKYDKD